MYSRTEFLFGGSIFFVVIQPGKEITARMYVHFYFMDDFQHVVAKIDWEFASVCPMRTFIFQFVNE